MSHFYLENVAIGFACKVDFYIYVCYFPTSAS